MDWLIPLLTNTVPIVGSVILAAYTCSNNRKADREATLRKGKIAAYERYIAVIQKFNVSEDEYAKIMPEHIKEIYDADLRLVTIASPEVIRKFHRYKILLSTRPLNISQLQEAQGAILLAIRQDIGLGNSELSPIEIYQAYSGIAQARADQEPR